MRYDWEDRVAKRVKAQAKKMTLQQGFIVVGVIVAREEEAEGAFVPVADLTPLDMTAVDIFQDAAGDIADAGQAAVEAVFPLYRPDRQAAMAALGVVDLRHRDESDIPVIQ